VIAHDLKIMDSAIFRPEQMVQNNPDIFSHFGKGEAVRKFKLAS